MMDQAEFVKEAEEDQGNERIHRKQGWEVEDAWQVMGGESQKNVQKYANYVKVARFA